MKSGESALTQVLSQVIAGNVERGAPISPHHWGILLSHSNSTDTDEGQKVLR